MCDFSVERVRPTIKPRAKGSQCGVPSPARAGTITTPPASETLLASGSMSLDRSISPRPSRSHPTSAPATNTEPSRQYDCNTGPDPSEHPGVASNPFASKTGFPPVDSRRNAPVPYVVFASPASTQPCAKADDCWSPAHPAIGIDAPNHPSSTSPKTPDDVRTCGNIARGTLNILSSSSDHSPVVISKRSVRLAFVTSVACTRPPVNRHMRKQSTVPNRTSPRSQRSLKPEYFSNKCMIFVAEKYGSIRRPVRRRTSGSRPSPLSRSQIGADTRLCHTMAGATGFPVDRSHKMVVSR